MDPLVNAGLHRGRQPAEQIGRGAQTGRNADEILQSAIAAAGYQDAPQVGLRR